ncbi:MAG: hypothetical protein ACRCX2_13145 [Paraclostridium sp.]
MIFSINELGDINIDEKNETLCNKVIGDPVLSDFKTSKTIILTYFKHNNNLVKKFYKNKRNTLTSSEIKKFFDSEISLAFQMRPELIKFVKYEYINDKSSFHIMFYFYSQSLKKIMLDYDISI